MFESNVFLLDETFGKMFMEHMYKRTIGFQSTETIAMISIHCFIVAAVRKSKRVIGFRKRVPMMK